MAGGGLTFLNRTLKTQVDNTRVFSARFSTVSTSGKRTPLHPMPDLAGSTSSELATYGFATIALSAASETERPLRLRLPRFVGISYLVL